MRNPFRSLAVGSFWLILTLLSLCSPAAHAASYYWVGGSGTWSDLAHWAATTGGAGGAYGQVPQSTDDVYFNASSFTAANQTVALSPTVTCLNMDWRGINRTGVRLTGSGIVEVNANLHLVATMGTQAANFRFVAASTGQVVDLQNVLINGYLNFDKVGGGWTFSSDVNVNQYSSSPTILVQGGTLNFGSVTVNTYSLRSNTTTTRAINLGSSTINLQSPVNTWTLTAAGLTFDAGTSTINLGVPLLATKRGFTFSSSAVAYNNVNVAVGANTSFSVAGSSFNNLTINGAATLSSTATINQTLTIGKDALFRAPAGQTVTFAGAATMVSGGDCGGLATLQSRLVGSAATFARAAGWGGVSFGYATVQDIKFTGGGNATATTSIDRGGNTSLTTTALPTTTLYWVGGTGSWHDATHWASTSGGAATGSCLPTLHTNVVFDASSFTAANQVVTLEGANAFCANMDWSAVTQPVAFRTASNDASQRQLGIGGSLALSPSMDLANLLAADIFFYGSEVSGTANTITLAGRSLLLNVYVQAPGNTYTLQDALTLTSAAPATAVSTNGRLYIEAGTFTTNNQAVATQGFTAGYATLPALAATGAGGSGPASSAAVVVNLGSSTLSLTPPTAVNEIGGATLYTWDFTDAAVLNAGTSTINLGANPNPSQATYFRGGLKTYNIVNFTDANASTYLPTLAGSGATFGQLSFTGSAAFNVSNTYTQQLLLAGGHIYTFTGSAALTQTFSSAGVLNAAGSCQGVVVIVSGNTLPVTFTKPAGGTANPALQAVALQRTTFAGGAAWTAAASFDNGNNTGITFSSPPVARALYWVGGSGNWSDAAHWALSSGGAGGNCLPTQADDVVVDANSFTSPGQTLTQDAGAAVCRSISWAAVVNNPTFAGVAANSLNVYGSITWASGMTLSLLGETLVLGSGTITSAGQLFQNTLTLNAPGATVTLGDALQQPLTGSATSGLVVLAGTLTTNDQMLRIRNFVSTTAGTRVLNLGASAIEITSFAWNVGGTGLTINAGTSAIYVSTTASGGGAGQFTGGGFTYGTVRTSAGGTHSINSNNTIAALLLYGSNTVAGSNTITQQLYLEPGSTFLFGAGTTTTFAAAASVDASGTGSKVITLQSTTNGTQFSWTKPSGTICASYIYLRDSRATGGASYEAGQQANNQGNNTGWDFTAVPLVAYADRVVCPNEGAHYLRFTFTAFDNNTNATGTLSAAQYPLQVVVRNLTAGTNQTVTVNNAAYDFLISTSTATTRYQVLSITTSTSGCGAIVNTGPFATVTDAVLSGPPGQWAGTVASGDWADCHNWASGTLPTSTTDVTVGSGPTIQPTLSTSGAVAHNLTIAAGTTFTVWPAGQLAIYGNWAANGTAVLDAASQVSFVGSSAQAISNGTFGSVVVNNPAGLLLQSNASTSGSLTLTAGPVTTGSYQWQHTNPVASSLSGYGAASYVAGNLRRAVASGVSTYGFPVGTASQYALLELVTNNLTNTAYLDAKFGAKPGDDTGLSYTEPGATAPYQSVNSAGVWTLTPDTQPSGGTYDVRVALAPFSGLADNNFAVLKRRDDSNNAADWTGGAGILSPNNGAGRKVADGYALRQGLSSFSQFGLGQMAAASLPVTLTSFTGQLRGLAIALAWTTASEVNSAYFGVERSLDGRTFVTISQVAAAGSNSTGHRYQFQDAMLPPGTPTLYYRLRQVDLDGTYTYSPVRMVAVAVSGLALFPNPATALTTLTGTPAGTRVQVLDALGRAIATGTADAAGQAELVLPTGLASGVYVVRAGSQALRLLVQ